MNVDGRNFCWVGGSISLGNVSAPQFRATFLYGDSNTIRLGIFLFIIIPRGYNKLYGSIYRNISISWSNPHPDHIHHRRIPKQFCLLFGINLSDRSVDILWVVYNRTWRICTFEGKDRNAIA